MSRSNSFYTNLELVSMCVENRTTLSRKDLEKACQKIIHQFLKCYLCLDECNIEDLNLQNFVMFDVYRILFADVI